jgi:hypothetical protein
MALTMLVRRFPGAGLLLVLLLGAPALSLAATPAAAAAEIGHLLAFIADSGCAFNRNGNWYDAKRGAAHLRDKYRWLAAKGTIDSAEDFVDTAATASSISGQPYEVKCGDGAAMPTGGWLRDELTRYRACGAACTTVPPGAPQSAPIETPHARPTRDHAIVQ